MHTISSREFRNNQKKYLDLVDQNERVIVQQGREKAYEIKSLDETEYILSNPEIMESPLRQVE